MPEKEKALKSRVGRPEGLGTRVAEQFSEKVLSASFPEGPLGPALGDSPRGAGARGLRGPAVPGEFRLSLLSDGMGDYAPCPEEPGASPEPSDRAPGRLLAPLPPLGARLLQLRSKRPKVQ